MDVKQWRTEQGMRQKELALMLKPEFPGMAKHVICMVENPSYGVRLVEKAERMLFGWKKKKAPNRRKPCRVTCRLDAAMWERFSRVLDESGMSMQEAAEKAVTALVNVWERNREERNDENSCSA